MQHLPVRRAAQDVGVIMRHASLEKSARLRRTLIVLIEVGGWISTRTLLRKANICAVNSVIAELRENGAVIDCEVKVTKKGKRRWCYRLIKAPEGWNG